MEEILSQYEFQYANLMYSKSQVNSEDFQDFEFLKNLTSLYRYHKYFGKRKFVAVGTHAFFEQLLYDYYNIIPGT